MSTPSPDASTSGKAPRTAAQFVIRIGRNRSNAASTIASRGDDWLLVAVHAAADTVERGDRPAFPGAGPGSVVVEIWTE